jgi:hypothetical protein
MKKLTRDETNHANYYYEAGEVDSRITELEALAETLKNEAQMHAMEAKSANATINEINQFISGATGEPANWHGAQPVKDFVNDLKAQLEAAKKDTDRLDWIIDNASSAGGGNGFTLKVFVPFDCECVRTAIDAAIQAEGVCLLLLK